MGQRDAEQGSQHWMKGEGGVALFHRVWSPLESGAPCGQVVIAHGLGEHSGRYEHVGKFLAGHGFLVRALDHRGHGRSEGTRAHVEQFDHFVSDLERFRNFAAQEMPGPPMFVLGHSLGGAVVLAHGIDYPSGWDGIVLSGPAVDPRHGVSKALIAVGRFASLVAPRLGAVRLDVSKVSRDPAVVAAYIADPLVHHGKVSARLGAELLARSDRFRADAPKLMAPLLLQLGLADELVDPTGAQELFPLFGSADKTLKTYPGLAHEIYNEPEQVTVLQDLVTWLRDHVQPR